MAAPGLGAPGSLQPPARRAQRRGSHPGGLDRWPPAAIAEWLLLAAGLLVAVDMGLYSLLPDVGWYVGASGLLHGCLRDRTFKCSFLSKGLEREGVSPRTSVACRRRPGPVCGVAGDGIDRGRSVEGSGPELQPIGVALVGDDDNIGVPEVAVLSRRYSGGRIVVEVKNVSGATNAHTIWFESAHSPVANASIDDADINGVTEVAALLVRDADGRMTVQLRKLRGSPQTRYIRLTAP